MFNLSGSELIFLVVIALVVLGPDKLPEAMRKAGKAYADFKRMTSGFQSEMKSVLDEPIRELRETAELAKNAASWDTNMFNPAKRQVAGRTHRSQCHRHACSDHPGGGHLGRERLGTAGGCSSGCGGAAEPVVAPTSRRRRGRCTRRERRHLAASGPPAGSGHRRLHGTAAGCRRAGRPGTDPRRDRGVRHDDGFRRRHARRRDHRRR